MNKHNLITIWNAALSADWEPIRAFGGALPRYRVRIGREQTVLRRYVDGGVKLRYTVTLRGGEHCCCGREEDELIESLHRYCEALLASVPCYADGEEEVLGGELIKRPQITAREGGVSVAECTLALTARRYGMPRGVVPLLELENELTVPEGMFDLRWSDEGEVARGRAYGDAMSRRRPTDSLGALSFRFERAVGLEWQDRLLRAADLQSRGEQVRIRLYLPEIEAMTERGFVCSEIPVSVMLDRMEVEEDGIVFGGRMLVCGPIRKGYIGEDSEGLLCFFETDEEEREE